MIIFSKVRILIFLIHTLFRFQPLFADEMPIVCTFFTLDALCHGNTNEQIENGQPIEIRGFLYQTADSSIILAAEPDLKSCCVGSTSKRQKQLLIDGNIHLIASKGTPTTLQGNLLIDFENAFPFKLHNARIVTENTQSYGILLLAGSALVLISMVIFFKTKR